MSDKDVKEYLAKIGRKGGTIGGKAKGKRKSRGDSDYYKKLAAKATRARKAKAKAAKAAQDRK